MAAECGRGPPMGELRRADLQVRVHGPAPPRVTEARPGEQPGTEARGVVAEVIDAGFIAEPGARDAVLRAIPIVAPDGTPAGWFVALVSAELLIGFAQLDGALRFERYSSFAGHEPAARDW